VARVLARTPWTRARRALERRRPVLRVINYHGVPARARDEFARQVDHLLERFRPLPLEEVGNPLPTAAPGGSFALLTFDDGLANHLEVVAPVLEERGLRGIFSVPTAFPSVPADRQQEWFYAHVYPVPTELHSTREDCRAITWEGVGELVRRGHRVFCHTRNHETISPATPESTIEAEIVQARSDLERALNVAVDGFAWPGGFDPDASRAEAVVRRTYRQALCGGGPPLRGRYDPYRIYRVNLEASWPLDVVDLQLSGLIDAKLRLERMGRGRRRPRLRRASAPRGD
jgi:peptidoglycan/xylan/chitin deacetylase (PgdA/CDA1 family)